jgi:hypothetical protein
MNEVLKFFRFQLPGLLISLHPVFLGDPQHVFQLQQKRLRKLIKYAGRASPYYVRNLAAINLDSCCLSELPVRTA